VNIVITGAGKGIGYSLVLKCIASAKEVDNIFAISRNIDQLLLISEHSCNFYPIKCDITNSLQLNHAIDTIKEKCNEIDFLINNAGCLVNKSFNEIEIQDIDKVFDTNFKAPFLIIKELYGLLSRSKIAHVVNVSSMGGFQGAAKFAGLSVYSSSKAALVCLTECLAEEFKSSTIKVNALCIGAVDTEMLSNAFPNYKAPITSEQMAEFIFQFTCNNSRYMNGKVIPVALTTP
jgi:NAD(P)-dependent dehydrogenase (short-subunit alcohol dehydrogenase family)